MESNKKPRFDFPVHNNWKDTLPDPLVDESVVGTTYIGYSDYGIGTDQPHWMIIKIVVAGGITTTTYAGGRKGKFEYVWDDRASLNYSR